MLAYAGLHDGVEGARMYCFWYKGSLTRCNGCWSLFVGGRPGDLVRRERMRGGLGSATPRSCVVAMVHYIDALGADYGGLVRIRTLVLCE